MQIRFGNNGFALPQTVLGRLLGAVITIGVLLLAFFFFFVFLALGACALLVFLLRLWWRRLRGGSGGAGGHSAAGGGSADIIEGEYRVENKEQLPGPEK